MCEFPRLTRCRNHSPLSRAIRSILRGKTNVLAAQKVTVFKVSVLRDSHIGFFTLTGVIRGARKPQRQALCGESPFVRTLRDSASEAADLPGRAGAAVTAKRLVRNTHPTPGGENIVLASFFCFCPDCLYPVLAFAPRLSSDTAI
jgi:hypothetical protein